VAYCRNCGAQLIDEATYCSDCGAGVEDQPHSQQYWEAESADDGGQTQPPSGEHRGDGGNASYAQSSTVMSDEEDIQNYKGMAVLAYLSLLVLIPIFAAKESKFARFHANQGLVLMVSSMAYGVTFLVLVIVGGIFSTLLSMIFYPIIILFGIIYVLLWLGFLLFFVFAILGIINAATGKYQPLPIIGKYKILP